jgi:hypothetical protein
LTSSPSPIRLATIARSTAARSASFPHAPAVKVARAKARRASRRREPGFSSAGASAAASAATVSAHTGVLPGSAALSRTRRCATLPPAACAPAAPSTVPEPPSGARRSSRGGGASGGCCLCRFCCGAAAALGKTAAAWVQALSARAVAEATRQAAACGVSSTPSTRAISAGDGITTAGAGRLPPPRAGVERLASPPGELAAQAGSGCWLLVASLQPYLARDP